MSGPSVTTSNVDLGLDFESRRQLIEAVKKLAASDGKDLNLYQDALTQFGAFFTKAQGMNCSIHLTTSQPEKPSEQEPEASQPD